MIKYNFCAGPGVLPDLVLKKSKEAVISYHNNVSILSMSHRDAIFEEIGFNVRSKLKAALAISEDYEVLLMHGGASLQFSAVPLNFSNHDSSALYLNSGSWAKKAIQEAKKYTNVDIYKVGHLGLERQSFGSEINQNFKYMHYTDNETIDGVEFQYVPKLKGIPTFCDMSSSFLSKRVNIDEFDFIYAGAQKNLGPSGVTIVIIKKALLSIINKNTPMVFNYEKFSQSRSLLNTPVTFSWLVIDYVLDWFKGLGGICYFDELNQKKAAFIYGAIDHLSLFKNNITLGVRSRMNIVFHLVTDTLTEKFLYEAEKAGFYGLRGHRSVGGCRASLYNAMDFNGVRALVEFMFVFNKNNK